MGRRCDGRCQEAGGRETVRMPPGTGTTGRSFWGRPWLKRGCCANDDDDDIPGNPLRPASYLMAENKEYSTLIGQQFCIFNYLLFSYFEKPDTERKRYSMHVTYCSVSTAFFKYDCLLPIFSQFLWSRFAETRVYLYTNVLTDLRLHYGLYFSNQPSIKFCQFRYHLSRSNKMK